MTNEPTLDDALRADRDWKELVEYILQDDLHNRLTPRITDIAYTAWKFGRMGENNEDGGPCDWFTDTKPVVDAAIEKIRKDLERELAPADDKDATIARLTAERDALRAQSFTRLKSIEKLAEAGTFAQGIEAATGKIVCYGNGAPTLMRHHFTALANSVAALSPTPQADDILDDSSLRAQVGELGNQIHTLGCEYQSDERLVERLGELRSIAWGLSRVASVAPQSNAVSGITYHEQKSQAARCPCKGSDDWCPCQNTPDRATLDARALAQKEPSHD